MARSSLTCCARISISSLARRLPSTVLSATSAISLATASNHGRLPAEVSPDAPRYAHPIARRHPVTGQKALFINRLGEGLIAYVTRGVEGSRARIRVPPDAERASLMAMAPDFIVMRHSQPGAPHFLARHSKCSVINAGDGAHEHPTQALLDAFTIRRRKGRLAGLRVTVVGELFMMLSMY